MRVAKKSQRNKTLFQNQDNRDSSPKTLQESVNYFSSYSLGEDGERKID